MKENRGLSSSDIYIKKSNRRLLLIGLGLLLVFLIALAFISEGRKSRQERPTIEYNNELSASQLGQTGDASLFPRGSANLKIDPTTVDMNNVVIGSKAEAIVTLTAENAPILFLGMDLAEVQQDGFMLETTCTPNAVIAKDASCNIKVLWNPVSLRQIQNIMNIRWKEDSPSVFREERTAVNIRAQSTDSKDCVICEDVRAQAEKKPRYAMGLDGKLHEITDGTITLPDGTKLTETENGLFVDQNGNIVAIATPKRIPLGMDNTVLGSISETQDIISANGDKLGRLLGDDTIVDSSLKVLGAAVPVVSVMDDQGKIIGKLLTDGTVVNAGNVVIGKPRVDNSVVDLEGKHLGFLRPWGLVSNFTGQVIGGIIPDGTIVNGAGQTIGSITPTGLAIDSSGELIGGLIPRGVAVGSGCQSIGTVLLNGQVKDSYEQIVGTVLLDGSVVNAEQTEIGSVISQGLVIDEKGTVLGFINSEGKAVDAKGAMIGCLNPDGSVSAGKRQVGAVMEKGRVIGYGCQVIGSVYPDGSVMNDLTEVVGRVLADKYVMNLNNKVVGVVIPRGTAIAEGCRLLGLITVNGSVVDLNGTIVGCMTPDRTVVNEQREVIGSIAPKGLVVDKDGKVIGRVRLDGKVIDREGKVIGCVNPDGTVTTLDGKLLGTLVGTEESKGVILGEDGNPKGWSIVGDKIYDEKGVLVGTLQPNGWIVGETGKILGVVVPDGVVFSFDGRILGRYSKASGAAFNETGEKIAVILPDYTALNPDRTAIIGALIPDKTVFMDFNNNVLGTMQIDGSLKGSAGEVVGLIRADGSVVNQEGLPIGMRIPTGRVFSSLGKEVGVISDTGEILSPAKTKIGRVLANGLAVSNDGKVLGGVFPDVSLAMSGEGVIGYPTYQGTVNDKNGRQIGALSPFGLVLGSEGDVVGKLVRVGAYLNTQNQLIGWSSFDGDLVGRDGRTIGHIVAGGIALDKSGVVLGSLVNRGFAVDSAGQFLGPISPDNRIVGPDASNKGILKASQFVYNANQEIVGQLLKPGVAVDQNGQFIGWVRVDGSVENDKGFVGRISLDRHVLNQNGSIVGSYIPLDSVAFADMEKSIGFVNGDGSIVDLNGQIQGSAVTPLFVARNGRMVGRLSDELPFVNDNTTGKLIGIGNLNGSVIVANDNKPLGSVMTNGLVVNLTKEVVGGLAPIGFPVTNTLVSLGEVMKTGEIVFNEKLEGMSTGTGVIYNTQNVLAGSVLSPSVFIGRNGALIGRSMGTSNIVNKDNQKLATQMPFGSALTLDNLWAGGVLPMGVAVNDDALEVGIVTADGALISRDNAVVARIMTDGVAVSVSDRELFTTMPYAGNLTKQGLPVGYDNEVLGRTTLSGDILNASDKKVYRILDDGTILGGELPLAGAVVSFGTAVSHDGTVLGILAGDGTIQSATQETKGTIAVNGAVKGSHQLEILGAIVPDPLVTNNCQIVGQTTHNGQVINGRGEVVGRVLPDKWVVNTRNERIGRVTRKGAVLSPTGEFLGRTLPDSTVVDTRGVNMGCARNDGSVVDNTGAVVGHVIERGLAIGEDGKPIGRVKFNGDVVDKNNTKIGQVLGDGKGTIVDSEGNVIGRMIPKDQEIFFHPDGTVSGTFGLDGTFTDPQGNAVFRVLPNGDIVDPVTGEVIGRLKDGQIVDMSGKSLDGVTVLRDKEGRVLGIISGCDVLNNYGEKIASIMADGSIIDLNGEVFGTVLGDGKLLAPDGSEMGSVGGTNPRLDRCGIKTTTGLGGADGSGTAGRRIFIGKKAFTINNGSIIDETGTVIGYMGEDGRPYSMDNRLLTGADSQGRTRPDLDKKTEVTPEQVAQMQQLLAQKRASMRQGISKVIKPDGKLLAKSKKKQDPNWGLPRIVSSWPVDMSRMIMKDKAIPAVIVRSIDSRYVDVPVTAIVERHIYSESGRNILIPAGSRIIGKAESGQGENHVAKLDITWERLVRPDGGAFIFQGVSGDAQGRGGVAAYLDEQLMKKYGKPVLTSTVTSAISYMMAVNDDVTTTENGTQTTSSKSEAASDARENFINAMDQIFQQLIDESTDIPPVVYVPSGTRVTVFSNEDLWLRSEDDDVADYEETYGKDSSAAQKPTTGSWVDKRTPNLQSYDSAGTTTLDSGSDMGYEEEYYEPDDSYYYPEEEFATSDMPEGEQITSNSSDPAQEHLEAASIYDGQKKQEDLTNRVSKPVLPKAGSSSNRLF